MVGRSGWTGLHDPEFPRSHFLAEPDESRQCAIHQCHPQCAAGSGRAGVLPRIFSINPTEQPTIAVSLRRPSDDRPIWRLTASATKCAPSVRRESRLFRSVHGGYASCAKLASHWSASSRAWRTTHSVPMSEGSKWQIPNCQKVTTRPSELSSWGRVLRTR